MCLDTFPFTGVTTTFEALWKNVPVITKTGLNFNSRCGESILKNANMSNFIATSCDEYIEKAVFYANNIDKLENARKKLFELAVRRCLPQKMFFLSEFAGRGRFPIIFFSASSRFAGASAPEYFLVRVRGWRVAL